jgi:ankyrin repeat protein
MLAILLWSVFTAGIVLNVFMPALWVLGGVSFIPSVLFLKALFKRDQYEQKISDFFQNATDLNQIERLNRSIFDGLDPNIKNRDGITALILVARNGGLTATVEALLAAKANLTCKTNTVTPR